MSGIALLVAKYCILSEIVFFNVVGLFGLLLAMNAFFHIFCLLGELVNACFILFGQPPARSHCYSYIAIYIFSICQQVFITLSMAVDLLVALLFPIWCNSTPYLLVLILMGTTYSLTFTAWGFVARDDEVLSFCNPPLAKPSANRETRRVVKRLEVSVVVFIFSWYMAILGVNVGYALGLSEDALAIWRSNMPNFLRVHMALSGIPHGLLGAAIYHDRPVLLVTNKNHQVSRHIQLKGLLLAMNAFYHIICLVGELVNASFLLFGHQPSRRRCYKYIMAYVFSICQQVSVTLLMAIDLLVALIFPIWYRRRSTAPYIVIFAFIGSTYSLPITLWGFIACDDETIPFCNPPMGKPSTSHETRRVLKRLRVTAVVFIFSWYMAILGVKVGYAMGLDEDALAIWQSNMVVFALLCYSQAFYVCLWRSFEYREAFLEQLAMMTGNIINYQPKPVASNSTTTKVVQLSSKLPR
ncbi:hypothetical protein OSTOST_26161 [Ostertagia ostertagi]